MKNFENLGHSNVSQKDGHHVQKTAAAILTAGLAAATPSGSAEAQAVVQEGVDGSVMESSVPEYEETEEHIRKVIEEGDLEKSADELRNGPGNMVIAEFANAYGSIAGREIDPDMIVALAHLVKTEGAQKVQQALAFMREHVAGDSLSEEVREKAYTYQLAFFIPDTDSPYGRLSTLYNLTKQSPEELEVLGDALDALREAGYQKVIPFEQLNPDFVNHLKNPEERTAFVALENAPKFRNWLKDGNAGVQYTQAPSKSLAQYLEWSANQ